jgi:site-specific DNA recombinase
MKAALYGRYSTDRQREASIEDQFRNCEQFAKREGWEIGERFADQGVSGARADRPAYQRALAKGDLVH